MFLVDNIIIFVLTFLLFVVLIFCTILYLITSPYPEIIIPEQEKQLWKQQINEKHLPELSHLPTLHLSVIVPAYNEEKRLKPMLDECIEYLEKRTKRVFLYEIIVVSDGSTDETVRVAQSYAKKCKNLRVFELVKNRGKGGAVRIGMLHARGSVLLFADADGATKFRDLKKLEDSMEKIIGCNYRTRPRIASEAHAIVCGSRAHLEKEETAKRSIFRLFLMHGFHFLVWTLCVHDIRDTQCGFKLFTRQSARLIFNSLHVERWAFDVEMLYIAQTFNIPITEIAVEWTEIEGSKIIPFWSWLQMGRDLVLIWLRYKIGAWKVENKYDVISYM